MGGILLTNMVEHMNEKGSIAILPAVIIATLSLGLAASMYLDYSNAKSSQEYKRQTQGELTDLRYQVQQDQLATLPSPAASPTPSASPATVLGSQSLAISEMGVKLAPSAPMADLNYAVIPSQTAGAVVVGFKSDAFSAKYPNCTPGSALGQLVRRPSAQKAPASNIYILTVGDFKYYYYNPGNTCATSTAGRADVAAATIALKNTILKTISQ